MDTNSLATRFKTWRENLSPKTLLLFAYVVALILASVANFVYLKKVLIVYQNYPFFVLQFYNVILLVPFIIVVVYKIKVSKTITKEMRAFPQKKFFIMGVLDSIANLISVFGGNNVDGALMTLLTQAVIPITMGFSILFLKARYKLLHYVGSLFILGGVAVSLVPSFKGSSGGSVFWSVFLFCGNIPTGLSLVYKEHSFKKTSLDVYYLQLWDNLYVLLLSFFLMPLNLIIPPAMSWSEIFISLRDGFKCTIGIDTLPGDNCSVAFLTLFIFVCFNLLVNIITLLVVKNGSAALMNVAASLALPLSNVAFSLAFIMGKEAVPVTTWNFIGLGVILLGLVVYRMPKEDGQFGDEDEKTPLATTAGINANEEDFEEEETEPMVLISGGFTGSRNIPIAMRPKTHMPRTHNRVREDYFRKLNIGNETRSFSPYTI